MDVTELEDLATRAELRGKHEECVAALHQEFLLAQETHDLPHAVHAAFRLAMSSAAHGERAMSAGWTSRAEGLVAELEPDSIEHGWVAFLRMFRALEEGDFATAAACAAQSVEAGRRHGDADLTAIGTCSRGRMAIYSGRIPEGLALLDDAMVRVLTGELSPVIAGHIYCTAIEGCQEISDFARVAEWTEALERWCGAQPDLLAFTGQCALHRGQLLRLHGHWAAALTELDLARQRYLDNNTPDAIGLTAYESGELYRLRGDLEAAEAAYGTAADHGFDPQPGLALLWLARGHEHAARAAVLRLLDEPGGPVQRVRLLPGAIEVLVVCEELDQAREAAEELANLAAMFGARDMEANASLALGRVELARGDAAGALPYLRKAFLLAVDDPHVQARARVFTGQALLALGDPSAARTELESARATFRRLGAIPEADRASELAAPTGLPAGLTAREVEVLRLVASGRSNAQIAAALVLSEKTVARHLSNIFTKLDVGSRTAATAFAFGHGLVD